MDEQTFGWWMVVGSWTAGVAGVVLTATGHGAAGLLLVGLSVGLSGFALWRLR